MGRAEVRRTHGRVGRAFQPVLRKQRRARPVAVPVTPTGRPLAATHPIPGRRPREWGATLGGKGVKHNRRRHFRMPGTQGMGGGRAM